MDDLLTKPYVPTVVAFRDSDALEYVTEDGLSIYERVDENLDIIRNGDRQIIGFRLNWWSSHKADLRNQDDNI